MKRKMTVLEVPPPSMSSTTDDGHPLKKLNDDLTRVTINFINDHLYNVTLPQTIFICLPREVRRHHVNNSWLADEKILYQIKSFDFNQFNKAKDVLATLTHDLDDTTKNRYRRYTDGNRQSMRLKRDLSMLTTCQDDLHVRSLGMPRRVIGFGSMGSVLFCFRIRYQSVDVQRKKSLDFSHCSFNDQHEKLSRH